MNHCLTEEYLRELIEEYFSDLTIKIIDSESGFATIEITFNEFFFSTKKVKKLLMNFAPCSLLVIVKRNDFKSYINYKTGK